MVALEAKLNKPITSSLDRVRIGTATFLPLSGDNFLEECQIAFQQFRLSIRHCQGAGDIRLHEIKMFSWLIMNVDGCDWTGYDNYADK